MSIWKLKHQILRTFRCVDQSGVY